MWTELFRVPDFDLYEMRLRTFTVDEGPLFMRILFDVEQAQKHGYTLIKMEQRRAEESMLDRLYRTHGQGD